MGRGSAVKRKKARHGAHESKYAKKSRGNDPDFISATRAVKTAGPRGDVKDSMRKIVSMAWSWDENFAKCLGLDGDKYGYYLVPDCANSCILSPEDCYELFTMHNYENQRAFSTAHAERLAAEIAVIQIDICIPPDNYPIITNGQHQLWAAWSRGQTIQASVKLWMCRDRAGVANNYAIHDSNKKRSAAQILETQRKEGLLNISHSAGRHHAWSKGVACAENDFRQPKSMTTNSAKIAAACRPEVIKFANWMEGIISDLAGMSALKNLVPMGIKAGFYAMWHCSSKKAEEFIRSYLLGADLARNSPVLILYRRLGIARPPHEHQATACRLHAEILYTCWRKFCRGDPLSATRRTLNLPRWDRWGIFVSPERPQPQEEAAPVRETGANERDLTLDGTRKRIKVRNK